MVSKPMLHQFVMLTSTASGFIVVTVTMGLGQCFGLAARR